MGQALVKTYANRFLLIDDDPIFCELLRHDADTQGVLLDCYTSLLEFDHRQPALNYDGVFLDFDMGQITGPDSIGYISSLFGNIPIILISALPYDDIRLHLSGNAIDHFVQKSEGYRNILQAGIALRQEQDYFFGCKSPSTGEDLQGPF
jgi:DNA-binding response OmpR family regulator